MDADDEIRKAESSGSSTPPPTPASGSPPLRAATSPRSGSESPGGEDSDVEEQPVSAGSATPSGASKRKPVKTHQIQVY